MPEMWIAAPPVISFHVQGFHVEFFAAPNARARAAAIGADDLAFLRMILRETRHTLQLREHVAEVKFCLFGDGAFADLVPVELYRVVHVRGDLPYHEVDVGDAFGVLLARLLKCPVEDGLG